MDGEGYFHDMVPFGIRNYSCRTDIITFVFCKFQENEDKLLSNSLLFQSSKTSKKWSNFAPGGQLWTTDPSDRQLDFIKCKTSYQKTLKQEFEV